MLRLFILPMLIMSTATAIAQNKNYEVFGHRGCRGLLPENTIPAFQKALSLPIDGIEWDVVVNKDSQLIISHEPVMDATYCLDENGKEFSKSKEKNYNIFQMTTAEVKQFDCGSKPNPNFPQQEKIKLFKPTLQEAFQQLNLSKATILFEIKSVPKEYNKYQPTPEVYAAIIAKEIANFPYKQNIIFMCFDKNMLEAMHKLLPNYRYIYLTYLPFKSSNNFIDDLSFKPYALGMYHATATKKAIKKAHSEGVKVFAWTVNKIEIADKLKRFAIDGIITDYPNIIQ